MKLRQEQIEAFDKKGYLVIEKFYSLQELDDFRDELRALVRTALTRAESDGLNVPAETLKGAELNRGILVLEEFDHNYIKQIYDIIPLLPSFMRLSAKRESACCINQLMRRPENAPLYLYTNRCLIQFPHNETRTYGWHQEVFYSPPRSMFLQTWAPLIYDASQLAGTISVREGSHQHGILNQTWHESKDRVAQIIVDEDELSPFPSKQLELELGSIVIFSSRLVHRSGINSSNRARFSLVGMYNNTDHEHFRVPHLAYTHDGITPRQYFEEVFGEDAQKRTFKN